MSGLNDCVQNSCHPGEKCIDHIGWFSCEEMSKCPRKNELPSLETTSTTPAIETTTTTETSTAAVTTSDSTTTSTAQTTTSDDDDDDDVEKKQLLILRVTDKNTMIETPSVYILLLRRHM